MPLIMFLYAYCCLLWCSSCTHDPRTSQVHLQVMHLFRGRHATTLHFETNRVLEFAWFSLKGGLKGKGELGPCKTSTALRWEGNLFQVHLIYSYCLFSLSWRFWWGNGVKGPWLISFWCLMPKGEKIRPKQEMDQLPLENFEEFWKVELELLFCQNPLIVSFS